eukprot:scaffold14272_cov99-Isochrysis_galbana.AAC.8
MRAPHRHWLAGRLGWARACAAETLRSGKRRTASCHVTTHAAEACRSPPSVLALVLGVHVRDLEPERVAPSGLPDARADVILPLPRGVRANCNGQGTNVTELQQVVQQIRLAAWGDAGGGPALSLQAKLCPPSCSRHGCGPSGGWTCGVPGVAGDRSACGRDSRAWGGGGSGQDAEAQARGGWSSCFTLRPSQSCVRVRALPGSLTLRIHRLELCARPDLGADQCAARRVDAPAQVQHGHAEGLLAHLDVLIRTQPATLDALPPVGGFEHGDGGKDPAGATAQLKRDGGDGPDGVLVRHLLHQLGRLSAIVVSHPERQRGGPRACGRDGLRRCHALACCRGRRGLRKR